MNRKQLLAASLGAALAGVPPAVTAQPSQLETNVLSRDWTTLVLPGGGARGAYEAGAVEGLRERAGISDGTPLPGLAAVCGTSIGSINGWFVATAQYTLLRELWYLIASEDIFRIKKQYAATVTPSSGILTRVFEAALISAGVVTDVTGLLDGTRVLDWLHRHIDPTVPVVMAYVLTATNLVEQRSEVFFRIRGELSAGTRSVTADRVRAIFGKSLTAREITNAQLPTALAGSAAIPILLDPVVIEYPDGPQTYVDGGVADSAPIDLARAVSNRIQLILVDPRQPRKQRYPNAAVIGTAAFGIAQNRVLESSLRSAYFETRGKRLFRDSAVTPEQRAFLEATLDVDIDVMRPADELPVAVPGFNDYDGIVKTYELGRQAGLAGFQPYVPEF